MERAGERQEPGTSPGVLASQGHSEESRPSACLSMSLCRKEETAAMGGLHTGE